LETDSIRLQQRQQQRQTIEQRSRGIYRIGHRDDRDGSYDLIAPDGTSQRGIKLFNAVYTPGDVVTASQRRDGLWLLDGRSVPRQAPVPPSKPQTRSRAKADYLTIRFTWETTGGEDFDAWIVARGIEPEIDGIPVGSNQIDLLGAAPNYVIRWRSGPQTGAGNEQFDLYLSLIGSPIFELDLHSLWFLPLGVRRTGDFQIGAALTKLLTRGGAEDIQDPSAFALFRSTESIDPQAGVIYGISQSFNAPGLAAGYAGSPLIATLLVDRLTNSLSFITP
jgi:hypothetical protein